MPLAPSITPRRTRNAEATRNALVSAATLAFTERGFEGASVDAIARAAGANKAMVSYHFGGKAGLYNAILQTDFEALAKGVAAIRSSDEGAVERLHRFIDLFGDLHLRRPHLSVLLLREILNGGHNLEPVVLPRFVLVFQTVAEIAAQGAREGVFREVDPFLFHQSLVGGLIFFFAIRPFRERLIAEGKVPVPAAPSGEDFIRHIQEFVVRGLAPPPCAASEES